ncbi:hypothetical protein XBJ1_2157 [Xenorhabdus bovienii SS-2004]|uniref:Uncharacterized protein n=1 Tax=Xenorhabdus bovienii (strain SS-2004) TaxID=406818 RepID=D3V3G8_XENBS|nr:hypothetical protein XBJ1_2157 [Xenorhabdus bovienii SS-2004]
MEDKVVKGFNHKTLSGLIEQILGELILQM